jgi:hypothetical protein
MTDFSHCPDCSTPLGKDRAKCRCGWVKPAAAGGYVVAGQPRPICRAVGCETPAMNGYAHCEACDRRIRQEKSEARCRELGLTTVEEKKAYCRRMASRLFNRPSFERWVENLTQATVDRLALMGGNDDLKTLERFRAHGAIDEQNRLIPHEKRAEVRAAHEALVRAERERLETMLKAQGVVRRETEAQS